MIYYMNRILVIILSFIYSIFTKLNEVYLRIFNLCKFCYLKKLGLKCEKNPFIGKISILGAKYISIGKNTGVGKHCILECWDHYMNKFFKPQLIIGKECWLGEYTHITCANQIIIGDGLLTGRFVLISDNNHGFGKSYELAMRPQKRELSSKGIIKIGDNVWIGDKATILSNVSIGDGSIVAANSVVTKNVPPYSVVAGNPARVIKTFYTI